MSAVILLMAIEVGVLTGAPARQPVFRTAAVQTERLPDIATESVVAKRRSDDGSEDEKERAKPRPTPSSNRVLEKLFRSVGQPAERSRERDSDKKRTPKPSDEDDDKEDRKRRRDD